MQRRKYRGGSAEEEVQRRKYIEEERRSDNVKNVFKGKHYETVYEIGILADVRPISLKQPVFIIHR